MDSLYKSLQADLDQVKQETEVAELESDSSNFVQLLNDCLCENYEILQELDRLLDNARYYHANCNMVKTTGTTASLVGACSLIGSFVMAPLTGGFSLVPTAVGAALSVGGGVTNVVTDMVADKITKGIISEIETLVARKQKSNTSLNNQIGNMHKILSYFDLKGIAREYALTTILKALANQTLDLANLPNTNILKTFALSAVVMHEAEDIALKYLPQVGRYISISQKHLRFLYSFLGITSATGASALRAAGRLLGVVSTGLFAIVDIAVLIRDWRSHPPSEATIVDVKTQILQEIDKLEEMLEIIESLKDKVWCATYRNIPVVSGNKDSVERFLNNQPSLEKCKWNKTLKNVNEEAVLEHEDSNKENRKVKQKLAYDVVETMMCFEHKLGKSNRRYHVINTTILNLYQNIVDIFIIRQKLVGKHFTPETLIRDSDVAAMRELMIANCDESVFYIDLNQEQLKSAMKQIERKSVDYMHNIYNNLDNLDTKNDIRILVRQVADDCLFVDQVALRLWLKQSSCSKSDRLLFDVAVNEIKFMLYKLPDQLSDWVKQLK